MSDHHDVSKELAPLTDQDLTNLGTALGLYYSSVDRMRDKLNGVVNAWLNEKDNVVTISSPPSWATLVKALRDNNHHGLAQDIENKFTNN